MVLVLVTIWDRPDDLLRPRRRQLVGVLMNIDTAPLLPGVAHCSLYLGLNSHGSDPHEPCTLCFDKDRSDMCLKYCCSSLHSQELEVLQSPYLRHFDCSLMAFSAEIASFRRTISPRACQVTEVESSRNEPSYLSNVTL